MRRSPFAPAALAAVLLLAGCAPAAGGASTLSAPVAAGGDGSADDPIADATPAETTGYDCNSRPVDPAAFAERRPLSSLGEDGMAALDEATRGQGYEERLAEGGWSVLSASARSIELLRPVTEPYDLGNGEIPPDHEYLAVERVAEPGAEPAWMVWSSSPCALRLDHAGLELATVAFEESPDPGSDRLTFLVTEHACNSGQDAAGRVQLLVLEETDERVAVAFGVRPDDGEAEDCQGNPATPTAVALAAPLGDREVVDAGLVSPRPVGLRPGM
ncbi:hypothetical protein CMsap09_03490 [Clavibacter michiganensis]|uniref:Lipoprotein n=1 Tax=Clavibacter michiganensis TaxID=28447 RepID=A0A251XRS8_9MICO|nr:hypothetical protein CMsap09_03490 [Clavibacter michiganensis]